MQQLIVRRTIKFLYQACEFKKDIGKNVNCFSSLSPCLAAIRDHGTRAFRSERP
jgi:hypothetical protein